MYSIFNKPSKKRKDRDVCTSSVETCAKQPRLAPLFSKLSKSSKSDISFVPPGRLPLKFASWNANGLSTRLNGTSSKQWSGHNRKEIDEFLRIESPDVLCIQETKLMAYCSMEAKKNDGKPRQRQKIGGTSAKHRNIKEKLLKSLKTGPLSEYNAFFSCSDWMYSGTLTLIKKDVEEPKMRYWLPGEVEKHDPEGRIIISEFSKFILINTYVPNSGWTPTKSSGNGGCFQKRKAFDKRMQNALLHWRTNQKCVIWCGDLNVCATDNDASHINFFRHNIYKMGRGRQQYRVPNEQIYKGQPGVQRAEQNSFAAMMSADSTGGDLVDTYRFLHPISSSENNNTNDLWLFKDNKWVKNLTLSSPSKTDIKSTAELNAECGSLDNYNYSWRGSPPDIANGSQFAKYHNKGMRIDYFLISSSFIRDVENVDDKNKSVESIVKNDEKFDDKNKSVESIVKNDEKFEIIRSDILGHGGSRIGFLGSDHCPIILELAIRN